MPAPILLLTQPDESHLFDAYVAEILLTEGYNCFHERRPEGLSPAELAAPAVVIISRGAAQALEAATVAEALAAGARIIVLRPPRDWLEPLGLCLPGDGYALARDAYLRVNGDHPWLAGFPAPDLQVPGEGDVCPNLGAEPLAWWAGQLGLAVTSPAVALKRAGPGTAVIFTYDLAECVVRLHQGRPENASTGPDPDANRDGKFTPDDLLEGQRDFRLRHVPQADVHQDLLVRALLGLTADLLPLPRLWHFPGAAPGLLQVDGDSDSMTAEDLQVAVETCERHKARYTAYLMDSEIAALTPESVADLRRRGHAFGPHPWVSPTPTVEEWRGEIGRIVAAFTARFGFAPRSLRSHCCIFPGYDDSPRIFADQGLRLDTNFLNGSRLQSGFANGSALAVKFLGRDGAVIDCYEQSTVHGDDLLGTSKALLPPLTEDDCIALSRQVMGELAGVYHGVYHPYFHPIYLGGRGGIPTLRWLEEVLRRAGELGLPSVNAEEWLAFNDARRGVTVSGLTWQAEAGALSFRLTAPQAVAGLTVLLPPCRGGGQCRAGVHPPPPTASVDGEPAAVEDVPLEGLGWRALTLDLPAGATPEVAVGYGPAGG